MAKATATKPTEVSSVSNDGAFSIIAPYAVEVTIKGSADLLFHRWSDDDVAAKAAAAKNSKAKKSDNVESYVYRNDDDFICLPGEYIRQSIIKAAKYRQDPRSPRKSAMDLFKAGVVSLTELASLGSKDWDYLHRCRVTIQRNSITRTRPAFKTGWEATFILQILLPEYIDNSLLHEVLINAGRLEGVGDFRPTYGRFQIVSFNVLNE